MISVAGKSIAVLGAGRIGAALARRLLARGATVTVWNRTAGKADHLAAHGARVARDVHEAVLAADVVISVLSDGPAVVGTLLSENVLDAMGPGSLLIDLSTIDQKSSRRVAVAADAAGVRFVRGALSGSPAMVEAGHASALLSGDPVQVAAATDILNDVVKGVAVVGSAEEAKVVKLAINGMVGSAVLAVAEATVTIDAAGVSREAFVRALEGSAVWSPVVAYKSAALRDQDLRITATTANLLKDVQLVDEQQQATGVNAPVTRAILAALERAANSGLREADCIWITALLRAESGMTPEIVIDAPWD